MDTEEAQGADSDSRLFVTVSGCPSAGTAGRLKQPHTTGLQVPFTSGGESSEANLPRASSGLPAAEPGKENDQG